MVTASALFSNSLGYIKQKYNGFLETSTKVFNFDGVDKVGAFAKPFFALLSLQIKEKIADFPIFTAYDGFKTIKNSFSWIKSLSDIHKISNESIYGGFKRIMGLGISILNFIDFGYKNVSNAIKWTSKKSVYEISVFIGKSAKVDAIPLKQALGVVVSVVDLVVHAYDLFVTNRREINSNEAKAGFFAKQMDGANSYQAKLAKILEEMHSEIDKIETEDAANAKRGDLDIILKSTLNDARKYTVLKANRKVEQASSDAIRNELYAEAHALSEMDDNQFIAYKNQNIDIRRTVLAAQRKSAAINTAIAVASLASNYFAITKLAYGVKWVSSLLQMSELGTEKVIEGAAAVSGALGLYAYMSGLSAGKAPVKISAVQFMAAV